MEPIGSQAYADTLELTQLLHLAGVMERGARAEICVALLTRIRLPDEWEEVPSKEVSASSGRRATRGKRRVPHWRNLMDGGIVPVMTDVIRTEQAGSPARAAAANVLRALAARCDLSYKIILARTGAQAMLELIHGETRERDDSPATKFVVQYLNYICDGNRLNQEHVCSTLDASKPMARLLHHAITTSDIKLGMHVCRCCESLASPKSNRATIIDNHVASGLGFVLMGYTGGDAAPPPTPPPLSPKALEQSGFDVPLAILEGIFGHTGGSGEMSSSWTKSPEGVQARVAAASALAALADVGFAGDNNASGPDGGDGEVHRCALVDSGIVATLIDAINATNVQERQRQREGARARRERAGRGGSAVGNDDEDDGTGSDGAIYEFCLEGLCHLTAVAHIRSTDLRPTVPYLVEGLLTTSALFAASSTNSEPAPPLLKAVMSALFRISRSPDLRKVLLDSGAVHALHRVGAGLPVDDESDASECRILLFKTLSNLSVDRNSKYSPLDNQTRLVRSGVLEWVVHETQRFERIAANAQDVLAECRTITSVLEAQADGLVPDFERDRLLRPGAMNVSIDRYGGGGDGAGIPEELLRMAKNGLTDSSPTSTIWPHGPGAPSARMNDGAFSQVLVSLRHGVRVVLHDGMESSQRRMQLSLDGKTISFSGVATSATRLATTAGEGNDWDDGNAKVLEHFPVAHIVRVRRGERLPSADERQSRSRFARHFRIELDANAAEVVGGSPGKAMTPASFLDLTATNDEDFHLHSQPASFLVEARTVESCHLLADGLERIAELFCSEEPWKYWHSVAKSLPSSTEVPSLSPSKLSSRSPLAVPWKHAWNK